MKFLLFFLLSFFFFFFFSCTYSATTPEPTIVFDTNKEPLKIGEKYYVLRKPTILGLAFGGLTLSDYLDKGCPTVVSQASALEVGIPVSFHPWVGSDIRLSQSLNIKIETSKPACANSTVWQAGETDPVSRLPLITIGGAVGNPNCNTLRNWFKIEKSSIKDSYRLVAHPQDVCDAGSVRHELIILDSGNGRKKRLVRSNGNDEYDVIFAKAPPP
ncbi:21 kDa seed protein-like [Andrographis paniculata]|uniref:21 kDa seed protein-like n=1 Tax=Andrographis paniculata TaxID=175694 RepID=UPI0021E943B4|nr:21 kDa seed protein-like [Andrographis paniculata]